MKIIKPLFWDKRDPSFLALLLLPFSYIIKAIILLKKINQNKKKLKIFTICVGNIYLGGTGKTPISIEVFKIIKKLNKSAVFIKKKYKKHIDETLLLKKTGPVYEDKYRINSLNKAVKNKYNFAILDDGFQDYSIFKNINILCFNEKQWIGNGLTLPSGPLRENLKSIQNASFIFIKGKKNNLIEKQIKKISKKILTFYFEYKAKNIENFKNKKIIAFVGIGEPSNFFNLLKENKINVIKQIVFPDHHNYNKKDIYFLLKAAKENNSILLTTEKDYLRLEKKLSKKIYFLKIKTIIKNKNFFEKNLKKLYEDN